MAKRRKTLSKIARFRLRFTFWLDVNKQDEYDLAETIETLKTNKLFAKTIRDGIKLVVSLMDGRLDLLFDMYPWVREEFEKRSALRTSQALEAQLTRIEYLMGQGITIPVDTKAQQNSTGSKSLKVPALSLPRFEDDDEQDTLIITKTQGTDSAMNFVNTLRNLQ